ncbi:MAG: hypothetical protein PHI23_01590 [Candidatus Peribacteraceae bacterium]|nr:hypothetical protein [Candidatus Peribacteraceae bacterium]
MAEVGPKGFGRITEAGKSLLSFPIEATTGVLVDGLSGGKPLEKGKLAARKAAYDTLTAVPYAIGDAALAVVKGTLKLSRNLLKLLPLPFPSLVAWKNEREAVKSKASADRLPLQDTIARTEKMETPTGTAA